MDLWDQVAEVFTGEASAFQAPNNKHQPKCRKETMPNSDGKMVDILMYLSNVDFVPPSLPPLKGYGHLIVLEDNEAVIKMTIRGRPQTMRHVARTHRVDLDWILERIRTDPGVQMRYIGTKDTDS